MQEALIEFPDGYNLLDVGNGFRVEQWGEVITIRPEHQAYFKSAQSIELWRQQAHWEFRAIKEQSVEGTWHSLLPSAIKEWYFDFGYGLVELRIANNKHLGIFPEQQVNWELLTNELGPGKRFLNLFAYTGASSLVAAHSGAEVTHVESMKGTMQWAKHNAACANIQDIRWILDDAYKFIAREVKRGSTYDLIQLDPPSFGRGANGERWKIEDMLPQLLGHCLSLLNKGGKIILSTYTPKMTVEKLAALVHNLSKDVFIETIEPTLLAANDKRLKLGLVSYIKAI